MRTESESTSRSQVERSRGIVIDGDDGASSNVPINAAARSRPLRTDPTSGPARRRACNRENLARIHVPDRDEAWSITGNRQHQRILLGEKMFGGHHEQLTRPKSGAESQRQDCGHRVSPEQTRLQGRVTPQPVDLVGGVGR